MMGFWKTVIAGVVTALITGVGSVLFGFADLLLEFIGKAWMMIKWFFGYPIEMSIGSIIFFAITLLITYIFLQHHRAKKASLENTSKSAALSANEELIIQLLAEVDGRWLGIVNIADHLHFSNLIVEQSIDGLMSKDMLYDKINLMEGTKFRLSTAGRDYAINKGYVR